MKNDQFLAELFRELRELSKTNDIKVFSCCHHFRERGTAMPQISQEPHSFLFFDYLTFI